MTRERCWKYDWVVEFDIKAAFDQIDHGLLLKAVRRHIKADWILLYIERWLTAPFETADGARLPRVRGTPQGEVVSPMLMNLFMHYALDTSMQRHFPQCPFARYADDAVVHCRSQAQAQEVMHAIASRLAECGLEMHPEKSGIVYCRDRSRTQAYPNVTFTFLGFLFRPRRVMTRSGQLSTSFLPGVSRDALKRMRQTVRGWRLPRQTFRSLVELADQCNPTIRGWWNYYGAFYRTTMQVLGRYLDRKLARWARCKYKTLRRHKRRSEEWLHKMRKAYPRQFVHWQFLGVKGFSQTSRPCPQSRNVWIPDCCRGSRGRYDRADGWSVRSGTRGSICSCRSTTRRARRYGYHWGLRLHDLISKDYSCGGSGPGDDVQPNAIALARYTHPAGLSVGRFSC
ncbi:hypothetical protein R75465_07598 [Paraburkholderia aspalathi]|nr:hypothetical protein R75465_07598 [Paraburkholderia aspalathi]